MSGNQSKEQIRLSDSCQIVLNDLNKAEVEGDSEVIWSSITDLIQKMDSYPKEAKDELNIKMIFDRIKEVKTNILHHRSDRKEADLAGNTPLKNNYDTLILKNYQELKIEVESLLRKTKIIENRKILTNGAGWAFPFLTKYYQAIAYSGILNELSDKLLFNLGEWSEGRVDSNFTKQRSKLNLLSPLIEELNSLNRGFPDDLKQKIANINTIIKSICECLTDETIKQNKKASDILEYHKTLGKEMKSLYEETIERSVS